MKPGLVLTTGPASEPVTTAEALAFIRVDDVTEETFVAALILTARRYVENYLSVSLITTTWTLWLDGFKKKRVSEPWWDGTRQGALSMLNGPDAQRIPLMRGPNAAVTSISTFDRDDTETVYAASNYIVDDSQLKPEVVLRDGAVWPGNLRIAKAVKIVFTAGYANAAAVPQDIKTAMLQLVAHWYENRESVIVGSISSEVPMTVNLLLDPYRVVDL